MKHPIYALLLTSALLGMSLSSCKKDEKEDAQLNEEFRQFNDDSNDYKNENDQVDDDVNNTVGESSLGRFAGVQSSPLCGVTIDSSQIAQKILFFNFDGVTSCFSPSRFRSGTIKVQLTTGNNWGDIGSVLTLTYINFKVTKQSNNKWIKFNGVKTLKNVYGHDWLGFISGTASIDYESRAFNVNVEYDNGQTAIWNHARQSSWSFADNGAPNGIDLFNFECNGDTSLNGYSAVDSWGTNRFGQPFTTYYNNDWNSDTYCGLWRPTSGQLTHVVNSSNFVLTLGVDPSGNPITNPDLCAYGYKVNWTVNGNTQVAVLSY